MSAFFSTEMNLVPDFYYDNKVGFLKNCLKGPQYLCDLINAGLEIAYLGGLLQKRLMLTEKDFTVFNIDFSPTKRILFMFLPYPKDHKNTDFTYLSAYCLPYIQIQDTFKPLDLCAIQSPSDATLKNIIRFYRDSEFEIYYDVTQSNDNTFEVLCNMIFK